MKNKIFNCGIYQILNVVNGKRYIGQSIDLNKREHDHFYYLKLGRHFNRHLQCAYNKYGFENFKFSVLLYCDDDHLTFWEQTFHDRYSHKSLTYNICKCVDSPRVLTEFQKLKRLRARYKNKSIDVNCRRYKEIFRAWNKYAKGQFGKTFDMLSRQIKEEREVINAFNKCTKDVWAMYQWGR